MKMTKKLSVSELYAAYKDAVRAEKEATQVKETLKSQLFTLVPQGETREGMLHYHETYKRVKEKELREALISKLIPKTKAPQVLALTEEFTVLTEREGLRDA
jgi:hypothetical protein